MYTVYALFCLLIFVTAKVWQNGTQNHLPSTYPVIAAASSLGMLSNSVFVVHFYCFDCKKQHFPAMFDDLYGIYPLKISP